MPKMKTHSGAKKRFRVTGSGKIMRRLLRKIATDDYDTLGDTSTLADPGVVDQLIAAHEAVKQR